MASALRALTEALPWPFRPRKEKTGSTGTPGDPVIEGERIRLRPLREADAPAMWLFARDPLVTRFLPWEPMPSPSSILPFIRDQEARRKRGDALCFAILDKETGELIGSTDLVDIRRHLNTGAELGYLLARSHWGKGIMTEAATLTLRYAFDTLKLKRLIAFADTDNRSSRRVLEKLGMRLMDNEWRTVKGERRLYVRYEIINCGDAEAAEGRGEII